MIQNCMIKSRINFLTPFIFIQMSMSVWRELLTVYKNVLIHQEVTSVLVYLASMALVIVVKVSYW